MLNPNLFVFLLDFRKCGVPGISSEMPSDLAKKKAAKKKEAAKVRQQKPGTKKGDEVDGDGGKPEAQENGAADVNGKIFNKTLLIYCLILEIISLSFFLFIGIVGLTKELDEFELKKAEARAVTGVLASHPNSTDVHINSLSLTFHGQELLMDTSLELNSGRRYGLIGLNGTGNVLLDGCIDDLIYGCARVMLYG